MTDVQPEQKVHASVSSPQVFTRKYNLTGKIFSKPQKHKPKTTSGKSPEPLKKSNSAEEFKEPVVPKKTGSAQQVPQSPKLESQASTYVQPVSAPEENTEMIDTNAQTGQRDSPIQVDHLANARVDPTMGVYESTMEELKLSDPERNLQDLFATARRDAKWALISYASTVLSKAHEYV